LQSNEQNGPVSEDLPEKKLEELALNEQAVEN
jgi:hypothetical protein